MILKKIFSRLKFTYNLIFSKYKDLTIETNSDLWWEKKKNFIPGQMSEWQNIRFLIIKKEITKKSTVKDIGCGDGSILINLLKQKKLKKAYGIDNSKYMLDCIKKHGISSIYFDFLKNENYNIIPQTDYTLVLEVLEHLLKPEKVLLELLSKTNKKLIFSIPNTGFIGHRLRLLFGSFPYQWILNPSDHIRYWTYRDLIYWLKQLKINKKSKICFYEGIPMLKDIFPSLFAMGFIVIIDNQEDIK
ncbi:MAG: methionine biosynthesis protein MetW [Candidatus Muirbacterium halophilum]|nr:methionine biosynthesis protein MetW [Candidatus Muirbacterium halophilum]MCK9474945.1 methionine biosynthesis protein MetW [Candidatus Muirbacterium halophilum]